MRKQELGVLGRVAGILNNWSPPQFYLAWWLVLFISLAPQLSAQTTSTIAGTVRDKQGLTVAGAEVQVTSTELAIDRTVTTESDGTYRIAALPPGIYQIRVSKDGFQTELFKNIEVTLNKTLVYDVTLQVGSTNQTVEVNSVIPLLETTASSTGSGHWRAWYWSASGSPSRRSSTRHTGMPGWCGARSGCRRSSICLGR